MGQYLHYIVLEFSCNQQVLLVHQNWKLELMKSMWKVQMVFYLQEMHKKFRSLNQEMPNNEQIVCKIGILLLNIRCLATLLVIQSLSCFWLKMVKLCSPAKEVFAMRSLWRQATIKRSGRATRPTKWPSSTARPSHWTWSVSGNGKSH